jgi:Tol biopolymer transport system component
MVRFAAVVVCLVTLVATAGPAEAQYFGRNKVRYDHLDFRVLQTDHFDIYYYPEEEEATRHAARMAERWYARFSQVLHHSFSRRQTLVLYASHPHFGQTNVTPSSPSEGTGGLTERTKSRIAMPFAAGLGATDHVLGHEIAHAFQIDIAKAANQDAFLLPGWFIEGMAEYLSLGPDNRHTAMWLRDAAVNNRLPTFEQLDNPEYFPYRYGHALWSFVAAMYGDDVLSGALRSKARGGVAKLRDVTGLEDDELVQAWHDSITGDDPAGTDRQTSPPRIAEFTSDGDGARLHLAPALSPDGRHLMFISERDRLSLDLFMADAATGRVIRKVVSTAADPHFDSLQYIASAGAWDPSGRRFAMAALSKGKPVLVILDTANDTPRLELPLDGLDEAFNPSWSPDGERIVFSALKGGLSNLFIYSLAGHTIRQLTVDAFADLHPAWSPDGRSIAFATDRFTTTLETLEFGELRVGLLDLSTGVIRSLSASGAAQGPAGSAGPGSAEVEGRSASAGRSKQVSPQWAPSGDAVYYVSDRDGVSNVYRTDIESGDVRQVTDVMGGVSGITATSPALAVASKSGTLAFSVYRNGRYDIDTLDEETALSRPVRSEDTTAPQTTFAAAGTLEQLLDDPATGLPAGNFASIAYDDRLRLESIAPPFIGSSNGNAFGGVVSALLGVSFADVLRDRQLQAMVRVGTDIDDLAVQAAYTNRKGQWNWGVAAGLVPSRFVGAHRALTRAADFLTRETAHLRYLHEWGKVTAHYHLNRAQRFEFGAGVRRTGFEWQTVTRVIDTAENRTVSRVLSETPAGGPVIMAEMDAAFVHDSTVSGPTGPVIGKRLRLEVQPAFGRLSFADVLVDARRYFMPLRPVTLAMRIEHVGRYGPDASDQRLTPLVVGLQTRVRGYDLRNFMADECGRTATECSLLGELTGARLAVMNLELRAPLLGLLSRDIHYGRVPVEAIAFVDAGFMWTRNSGAGLERDRFRSVGAGARANIGGFLFELTAARPFDRAGAGWTTSLLLRPGW